MRVHLSFQQVGLWMGPLLFAGILSGFRPEGLSEQGIAVLACTLWVAVWWITEAVPLAVTSLLPIVLFPLTGALDLHATTGAYGHRIVFLFMGGFILSIAIERWGLHRRIALHVIHLIGTSMSRLVLGFMVACGFLSMWISNSATAVMMMPIAAALIHQLTDDPRTPEDEPQQFGKALMLAVAYSASIGGIATLIGTPPNLVLAGVVEKLYGREITFNEWFAIGFPLSVLLMAIAWVYLTRMAFPMQGKQFHTGREEIARQLRLMGALTPEEKRVLWVFTGTAAAWVARSLVLKQFLPAIDDAIIAVAAAIALFLIPAPHASNGRLLDWEAASRLPWGILLLFGGGLAIAAAFSESGLAQWIGTQFAALQHFPYFLLLLAIVLSVNFLTEITSNVATTSIILPVLAPLAASIGVHPLGLMVGATLAASCAFMLPVATPPNAVVFGTGYLHIADMARTGVVMNVISSIIGAVLVWLLLGWVWQIDLTHFPAEWAH